MRKRIFVMLFLMIGIIFSMSNSSLWGEIDNITQIVNSFPKQTLDENEIAGILKMRQEEKLARDVYETLYNKWGLKVFSNIAKSEQTHMDAVKALIEKYGLEDPDTSDTIGVFKDSEFTDLYNNLVNTGDTSIVDALKVGATIEDLDIKDLDELIGKTDNDDIEYVYNMLRSGSYNHLKAFVNNLKNYGETYTPQYISEDEFNEILSNVSDNGSYFSDNESLDFQKGYVKGFEAGKEYCKLHPEECGMGKQALNINTGWNLVGWCGDQSSPKEIFSNENIKTLWKWSDNKWKIWSSDPNILKIIEKYNLTEIQTLNPGEGFWVDK